MSYSIPTWITMFRLHTAILSEKMTSTDAKELLCFAVISQFSTTDHVPQVVHWCTPLLCVFLDRRLSCLWDFYFTKAIRDVSMDSKAKSLNHKCNVHVL